MSRVLHAGTSGFRGKTGVDILPEDALTVASIWTQMIMHLRSKKADTERVQIGIGMDQRPGARMLGHAAMSGVLAAGAIPVDLGMVTAGIMSHAITHYDLAGGVYITGSHMKPERIGIIPMTHEGCYAPDAMTEEITRFMGESSSQLERVASLRELCYREAPCPEDLFSSWMARVLAAIACVPHSAYTGARLPISILVDTGNATAGPIARTFFEQLSTHVDVLHENVKPFPERESEVKPENCGLAIARMTQGRFNLGVCFDGDADRILFIDETGTPLPDSVVGAIFADDVLHEGGVCVTPVTAGPLIAKVCRDRKARLELCRVGQPATQEMIQAFVEPVELAFEEAAGKVCLVESFPWYDALYTAARMMELMVRTEKSLSQLASAYPKTYRHDIKWAVPSERRDEVWQKIVEESSHLLHRILGGCGASSSMTDGLRIDLSDDAMVLVRMSGTEDAMRAHVDSFNFTRSLLLRDEVERFVTGVIG